MFNKTNPFEILGDTIMDIVYCCKLFQIKKVDNTYELIQKFHWSPNRLIFTGDSKEDCINFVENMYQNYILSQYEIIEKFDLNVNQSDFRIKATTQWFKSDDITEYVQKERGRKNNYTTYNDAWDDLKIYWRRMFQFKIEIL